MTSTEVITEAKTAVGKYLTLQNIAIGTAIILILVVTFLLYQSYEKSVAINQLKVLQAQNEKVKSDLTATLKASDDQIAALQIKLMKSSATITKLNTQLKKKQEAYSNVKPPKDRDETITRLRGLGYTPR
jgi:hypothetical protein